jgi:deazaflavin-dependent oxidoreductase (nitroreductase family)
MLRPRSTFRGTVRSASTPAAPRFRIVDSGRNRDARDSLIGKLVDLTAQRELPYVDPQAARSPLHRAYVRFLASRFANWLSRKVVWKLDPVVMRVTRGRVRVGVGLPTALLETRGARTGRLRRNGVIYFHDSQRVIIIASKLGLPEHPSWFHNLRANPDVVLGGQAFRAEVVNDESERAQL